MDGRIRFVMRLKDGESMAALCREFGKRGGDGLDDDPYCLVVGHGLHSGKEVGSAERVLGTIVIFDIRSLARRKGEALTMVLAVPVDLAFRSCVVVEM